MMLRRLIFATLYAVFGFFLFGSLIAGAMTLAVVESDALGAAGLGCAGAIGLWMGYRQHKGKRQDHHYGICSKCGYDLTGNVSGRCPECGAPTNSKGAT